MAADYIAALDYGSKRIGVAIAHSVARLPRPLTTLANTGAVAADIRSLLAQEEVGLVVVGLPRGMDGGYTAQTRDAEAFARMLGQELTVPVVLADETLTSVDAEAAMGSGVHHKEDIDAWAASFILERYLSEHPAQKGTHA